MTTLYPGALDTFPTRSDGAGNAIPASDHNDKADAIEAVEATLGLNPHGSFATVKARLDQALTVRKTADQTNATTTFANVTDLSFPVAVGGDYFIEFFLMWSSNTTG